MVSNYEVAKKFAEGKERATGSHMYIDGDTVYSYGSHFPIAKRWNKDGIEYLYNSETYSSSTGKHQAYVYGEISTSTVLEVIQCDTRNAESQQKQNLGTILLHEKKLARARVPHSVKYHKQMIQHYKEQNKLLDKYVAQTE
jgi:hypothetical protein